jgi:hypothetical protein
MADTKIALITGANKASASKHRSSLQQRATPSSSAHAAQAVAHGTHRQDSPQDTVMFGVIGVALLALFPPK